MIYNDNVFNEDSFQKLIEIKLPEISLRVDGIVNAGNNEFIQFLGWGDGARFRILSSNGRFDKILVAHEGNWVTNEICFFFPNCKYYEDLQKAYGHGLTFVKKEYSEINKRTLFLYNLDYTMDGDHILVVFPTGEEFGFEIYGIDKFGDLILLIEREL